MRIPFRHGETILHVAARKSWTTVCQCLLHLGADVNRSDILGRTALHHAARDNALDAVRLLIAHGANVNAKDWKERTPLELSDDEHGEVAEVIREAVSLQNAERLKSMKMLQDRKRGCRS